MGRILTHSSYFTKYGPELCHAYDLRSCLIKVLFSRQTLSGAFSYNQSADANQIVAAPGHIWRPQDEQVVYARRPNNGTDLHVTFVADPPTGGPSQVLQNLAPRLLNSADFMDIAAGDLDKVPDSAGDNHDEVVVAYASPGVNNQMAVNVAVLDYTQPAQAPPSPVAG